MINLDDIKAAADRLQSIAVRTPLISSPALDQLVGGRVLLKAENYREPGPSKSAARTTC
jgi:threonine dehydratase